MFCRIGFFISQRRGPTHARRSSGFSLLELNLVVVTIALVALVVVPSAAPGQQQAADFAGIELARALQSTRDLAQRTGAAHGLALVGEGTGVRLFRVSTASGSVERIFDVVDPLTKQPFDLRFPTGVRVALDWEGRDGSNPSVHLSNDGQGSCGEPLSLVIGPSGVTRCEDPVDVRLQGVRFAVHHGSYVRNLGVDSFTSRVQRL